MKRGDTTAADIYLAVGIALTSWEAAEDALLGLFRAFCAGKEPTLFDTYVSARRSARADMLRRAMRNYGQFITNDETKRVLEILKASDRYAQKRNEIAHGYCVDLERSFGGQLRTAGYFLLPSQHEGIRLDRGKEDYDYRFAHTSTSMKEFATALIALRDHIEPIMFSVMDRVQAETQARSKLISAAIAQQRASGA
ncbi:MAG: hypothetical protein WDO17_19805 [Alphaproteobacteria bacterium]